MTAPWFRASANMHADTLVRKARGGAAWHWVLCRLKDGRGWATDNDLDPWRAGEDMHIPEEMAGAQIQGLKDVGLLVKKGEVWTTPNWARYNPPDARARSDKRPPASVGKAPTGPKPSQSSRLSQRRDGTRRDETGQVKSESPSAGWPAHTLSLELPGIEKPKPKPKPKVADVRKTQSVEILNYWSLKTGIKPRGGLSARKNKQRLALITRRLSESYTVKELKRAIDVLVLSPNHNGQKDGRKYLEIKYALEDNLDSFLQVNVRSQLPAVKNRAPATGDRGSAVDMSALDGMGSQHG